MALRGKKATTVAKKLKALMYGCAGAGKTTAAISFPQPYLIDTEKGAENAQYVELLEANNGVIFQTCDFDEIMEEVKALLTEKHEYKTLIIDPLTVVYNDLLDKSAIKVGTEFGRHYGEANKSMKRLLNMLLRLDMNVIITSHAKKEYGANLSVLGQTFDCYKSLDYLFDLVLEIQKEPNSKRFALVRKSRIKTLEENSHFEFSYEALSNKYGRDVIERDAVPETLATDEQMAEILNLIDVCNISDEVVAAWLKKAKAGSLEEMNSELLQKCIDAYNAKLIGGKK